MKAKNNDPNSTKENSEHPISERKCTIDGKHFSVTRHFMGDRPLGEILTEIAKDMANREMKL